MSQVQWFQTVGAQQEYESAMHASRQSQQFQQEPEMKISQMMTSKYLKKDDCDSPPLLLTVNRIKEENVAREDQAEDLKWVMFFDETEKGLVLNTTNLQLAAIAFGSQDTDDWLGKQIVCYHDPNVSFAGKLVGGIRVRAPKRAVPAKSAATHAAKPINVDPRPEPFEDMDDDIPF